MKQKAFDEFNGSLLLQFEVFSGYYQLWPKTDCFLPLNSSDVFYQYWNYYNYQHLTPYFCLLYITHFQWDTMSYKQLTYSTSKLCFLTEKCTCVLTKFYTLIVMNKDDTWSQNVTEETCHFFFQSITSSSKALLHLHFHCLRNIDFHNKLYHHHSFLECLK